MSGTTVRASDRKAQNRHDMFVLEQGEYPAEGSIVRRVAGEGGTLLSGRQEVLN